METKIVELHLRHYTQDEIAAYLKTGKPRISRCIREFHHSGLIPGALRIGRPSKRSSALSAFIEARTLQSPSLSASELVNEIGTEFGIHISRTTINQVRKGLRFKYRPARHNQALNKVHTAVRIAFCKKMLGMAELLSKIHFSDESRIVLGDDKRWIWYRAGEDNPGASMSSIKSSPSIMVFAVIGIGFKSDLMLVEGSIKRERYIQNLDRLGFLDTLDEKHGIFGWIFQQDGVPAHTSQATLDWLEGNVDVIVDWPANSPDLSPIEMRWAILKKLVRRTQPKTIEELKGALIAAWTLIPQITIDRLCEGFQARLQLCLAEEGNSISNQLWRISQREALKDFFEGSRVHTPWTQEEDERLLRDWLTIGPKWKYLSKLWEERSETQLKNRWYSVLRHRLHRHSENPHELASVLDHSRRGLPIPQLFLPEGEVTLELNGKGIVT